MQNSFHPLPRLTEQFRLVTYERIQTMFWAERDITASRGRSIEVFRNSQYLCSLRSSEFGMGSDTRAALQQARLRNGDEIYTIDLSEQILYVSGSLTTSDKYNPGYNAQVTLRINNPLVFLQCYFEGVRDARRDPMNRIQMGIERALRRYAEKVEHDKMKRRELESATFKNGEGKRTGIWIERSFVDIIEDPQIQKQRQKIREIKKDTEITKIIEQSKADVQSLKSRFSYVEESKHREHSRREQSKDVKFELEVEAEKQLYLFQQKTREILFNTVNQQWAEYILTELDRVDNSIPELFRIHPEILQYFPALSQLYALPQLTSGNPSVRANTTDIMRNSFGNSKEDSIRRW